MRVLLAHLLGLLLAALADALALVALADASVQWPPIAALVAGLLLFPLAALGAWVFGMRLVLDHLWAEKTAPPWQFRN